MPGNGDDSRAFGPFVHGKSLYFSALNYDKESIALNLKQSADREIFEGLVGLADVLVENFTPGTMEKLGYGWETLHPQFPDLIYAAASGFGGTGPYSDRPAYDVVVQGMGGVMSVTGQPDSPPTRVGVSIGDMSAGLYLTIGILSALWKRGQGGGAVKVDVGMLDCQVAILESALTNYCCTGTIARPQGSRHPAIAPFQAYRTQDGYLVIGAANDHLFAQLARAMDRQDMIDNPNYATNNLRHAHVDLLEADMERTLRSRTTKDWLDVFHKAGVPCGPVNSVADVARDPPGGGAEHDRVDHRSRHWQSQSGGQSHQAIRGRRTRQSSSAAGDRRRSRRHSVVDRCMIMVGFGPGFQRTRPPQEQGPSDVHLYESSDRAGGASPR